MSFLTDFFSRLLRIMSKYKGRDRKRSKPFNRLTGTATGAGGSGGSASLTPFDFTTGVKLFQTGWESSIALVPETPSTHFTSITGTDNSKAVPNNHQTNLVESGHVSSSRIWYEAGTNAQRLATIENSPLGGDGQGKVLHFELMDANILVAGARNKGRVQHAIGGVTGIKEFYIKTKMLFPASTGNLRSYSGTLSWFTILELFNDEGAAAELSPFRLSVSIHKPVATVGTPLRFYVHGQEKLGGSWGAGDKWEYTNTSYAIPDDQWITMEYYFLEGGEPGTGAPEGRFVMVCTPSGEAAQVIFDVRRNMRHKLQGTSGHEAINGFNNIQPHKLYMGLKEIDHLLSIPTTANLYFDDFEIWYKP